jgi:UDP-N-acetyl-D-glucosamine dehydrogenase
MSTKEELIKKIEDRSATSAVIGLGYVGLPLSLELAKAGFSVIGIDKNHEKVEAVNRGASYIPDVPEEEVKENVDAGRLTATTDFEVIADCDIVNICVPTPLNKTRDPDISYIVAALEEGVTPNVHPGMLVLLESTTYPGTTEEVMTPAVTRSGLKVGMDVFVAFSAERVDPGNPDFKTCNIPKVVGGMTPNCTELACALYSTWLDTVFPVSSPAVAETVKIHENTFRSVNIALVNELAIMCDRLGIDVWEVVEGASTKPFGFMPFYPGPGIGGHCIPIDPYYLSWRARSVGFEARFITLAGDVNSYMPRHVIQKAGEALNSVGRAIKGSRILVLGVAYKGDIDDERESPAADIIDMLVKKGARVTYADPYIPTFNTGKAALEAISFSTDALRKADLVLIITDHSIVNYDVVLEESKLILDTRNAIKQRVKKVWRI